LAAVEQTSAQSLQKTIVLVWSFSPLAHQTHAMVITGGTGIRTICTGFRANSEGFAVLVGLVASKGPTVTGAGKPDGRDPKQGPSELIHDATSFWERERQEM
jgi:hypothetical protein